MGYSESQIGYLANKINLVGVRAAGYVDATAWSSCLYIVRVGMNYRKRRKLSKVIGHIHRATLADRVIGNA